MSPTLQRWLSRGGLLLLLVLTVAARWHNHADVFHDDGIYFVDGDCYSRMTRAKMVTEGQWVIRHQDFENWPQGVTPHTTAPMDWLIVAGKGICGAVLAVFDSKNPLRGDTLDLSGALISPFLAMLTAAWLWWWAGWMRLPFRGAMVVFFALSPILVDGMVLGRPDHQSLLILLLAVAVGAELALTDVRTSAKLAGRWAVTAGLAWGLALWVSLYEPAIFFGGAVVWHLWSNRTALTARPVRARWWVLGGTLAVALAIDGWRMSFPDQTLRDYFLAWSKDIGELKHLGWRNFLPWRNVGGEILPEYQVGVIWQWLGALWITAPVLLWLAGRRDPRSRGILPLLLVMLALTVWQLRWGYFVALAMAMSLPFQFAVLRQRWVGWIGVSLAIVPVLWGWSEMLRPNDRKAERKAGDRAVATEYRHIAEMMRSPERQPFLAAWWVSPQIAYWSGQPGIAGTSHQSLAGTVDSARFFMAEDPAAAAAILRARGVHWIVIDDSPILGSSPTQFTHVKNAAAILSIPRESMPEEPIGWKLAQNSHLAPPYLRYVTPEDRGLVLGLAIRKKGQLENTSMQFYAPQVLKFYEVLPDKL